MGLELFPALLPSLSGGECLRTCKLFGKGEASPPFPGIKKAAGDFPYSKADAHPLGYGSLTTTLPKLGLSAYWMAPPSLKGKDSKSGSNREYLEGTFKLLRAHARSLSGCEKRESCPYLPCIFSKREKTVATCHFCLATDKSVCVLNMNWDAMSWACLKMSAPSCLPPSFSMCLHKS